MSLSAGLARWVVVVKETWPFCFFLTTLAFVLVWCMCVMLTNLVLGNFFGTQGLMMNGAGFAHGKVWVCVSHLKGKVWLVRLIEVQLRQRR
ncbi:hypothetical protein QBC36DRAFT_323540 [Triangularia setosa]|uniref:Uncharacterized protein n=1 Tax=Triangularia setosa TaxID=2587417 RepID=A0AAN6WCG4_9PEZI|nr:hypothetical protein QBC36DRAFT_323540 [Podospora setosa]